MLHVFAIDPEVDLSMSLLMTDEYKEQCLADFMIRQAADSQEDDGRFTHVLGLGHKQECVDSLGQAALVEQGGRCPGCQHHCLQAGPSYMC